MKNQIMIAVAFVLFGVLTRTIFLFTWSAYILMPLIGALVNRIKTSKVLVRIFALEGAGILSVLIFFLWTNLGVVLTTPMYEKSLSGLISSYINALPFVKPQFASTLIAIPVIYILGSLISLIKIRIEKRNLNNIDKAKFLLSD